MKKILFVSPTGTLDNGAEISIFYFMEFLIAKGYQVYNVVPQYHHPDQHVYLEKQVAAGIDVRFLPSIKWWWEEAPGGFGLSSENIRQGHLANIREIRKLIKEEKIDILITNTVNMPQGLIAASFENIPHIQLIHEFPNNEFAYYEDKLDFILTQSDRVFSVVGSLHNTLSEKCPNVDIGTFIPYTQLKSSQLTKGNRMRLVSVGRLNERKNQLELLRAFRQIQDDSLELVFIGGWDESYKRKCDRYISENQIKNVTFTGHVDDPWEQVTDRDICVFSSAMETFGLVYVEAILNGVPTILSDNPGHLSAYHLFEEGQLYKCGNIPELIRAIENTRENFETHQTKSIAKKDLAATIYSLENAYKDVIEGIEKGEFTPKNTRHFANFIPNEKEASSLNKQHYILTTIWHKIKNKLKKVF
ncbi:glycosyltransferase family 4 protein [Streptococcus plurextorum]|uniref:glycosyltransferase family 4 protein n=1 Tax=Streptococcus plurextorum TaxID=456876 RepID=UPI00040F01A8|nr:glycosyltransferase family 4 protein [Streptococcus plurextorum]